MPRRNPRTLLVLLAACALFESAQGFEVAPPLFRTLGEVQILDRDSGEVLPVYLHNGQRWVAGLPGHRYAVRLSNRTYGRILAVVSVDGINAVTGESAGWSQRGYVLGPWQGTDVLGWRKSQERVADFVFGNLEDSYAARTGRPDNAGVIGVALFREAVAGTIGPPMPPSPGAEDSSRAKQLPAAPEGSSASKGGSMTQSERATPMGRLATEHGQSENSPVQMASFDRAQAAPDLIISIRYDRRERLVSMGIIPEPRAPTPFPESAQSGFVPDPPARSW